MKNEHNLEISSFVFEKVASHVEHHLTKHVLTSRKESNLSKYRAS